MAEWRDENKLAIALTVGDANASGRARKFATSNLAISTNRSLDQPETGRLIYSLRSGTCPQSRALDSGTSKLGCTWRASFFCASSEKSAQKCQVKHFRLEVGGSWWISGAEITAHFKRKCSCREETKRDEIFILEENLFAPLTSCPVWTFWTPSEQQQQQQQQLADHLPWRPPLERLIETANWPKWRHQARLQAPVL